MSNKPINQSIDWNCDDSISASPVESDVNPSSGKSRSLAPYDDWPNLQFDGGAIGELGAVLTLAATTDLKRAAEPTEEEFKAFKRGEFVDNSEVFFLLKNGSFERPYDATQDHYVIYFRNESNNPLESWTVNGSSGASFALFDREQFQSLTPAHENHYLGFWGTLLGIHQTVSTEIGAEYVLTFALSWTNGSPAGHGMTVLLNDEPASTYSFGEETGERGPWEYLTLRFTAQSAQTKIEFRSQRPETSRTGLLLDGVHLEFELDEH